MKHGSWMMLVLLSACATPRILASDRGVDLLVYPHLRERPETQALVKPVTLSTIATLDVIPYVEVSSGSYSPISATTGTATVIGAPDVLKLTMASPSIDPSRPFVLRKLKPNKNYRVYGRAYGASNSPISLDSGSFVDVPVGNNDNLGTVQLPICLISTSFAATCSVTVTTSGRFEYLKGTLYQLPGNVQLLSKQVTRPQPEFVFGNLEGNTNYRLVVEAYKLGSMLSSASLDIGITNETAPVNLAMSLAVPYVTTTFAGKGSAGLTNAIGTAAAFSEPHDVASDNLGNLYVADSANHCIRKISPNGQVTTLAGNGSPGFADAQGNSAQFNFPEGIAVDTQGIVYVADYQNHRIRKVAQDGQVTTLAGNGAPGFVDANGASAQFSGPSGLSVDSGGNVYVADFGNHRVRKVTPAGQVSTVAGTGVEGFANGAALSATFKNPRDVILNDAGELFVADFHNFAIRKISGGQVTTLTGNGVGGFADGTGSVAQFNWLYGIDIDPSGNIFVGDEWNQRVRKVTPGGVVSTLAGTGTVGAADGTVATFHRALGVDVDAVGNLYVADGFNHKIRKVQ